MHKHLLHSSIIVLLTACSSGQEQVETVRVDGSSTVFPIAEAVAEGFMQDMRGEYRVTVGVSGTGGGMKKFCRGEIDISNASRPIQPSERELCRQNGVRFIELPVAMDALTVVVNPDNDWVECMAVEELRTAWEPAAQGEVDNWRQLRAGFPDRPLRLFGPGTDSGTYDYFTEAVVGDDGASRGDFQASEDDNVLVMGVSNDINALGFFGLAYYEENQGRLKALAIKNPNTGECVQPSVPNAKDGTYQPLSRPLFLYVSQEAAGNAHVKAYIDYFLNLEHAPDLVTEVGYVPLTDAAYRKVQDVFRQRQVGTAYSSGAQVGISIDDLLDPAGKSL